IEKYKKYLSWYKIISYEDKIKLIENNDYNLTVDELNKLNNFIKYIRDYMKSDSYKAAYKLIDDDLDILELMKNIKQIKVKKSEKMEHKINEVKMSLEIINRLILYCNKYKKYLAAKNVIYNVIRNAWDGISFLNPQTKEKDMYLNYKRYFIEPTENYLIENKDKFKYKCFICGDKIRNLDRDVNFLNNAGFDTNRKTSHVWNFTNDVAICPLCKLIYSCVPAGINYIYNKGLYINYNQDLGGAININNKVASEVLIDYATSRPLTYKALVKSLQEQLNDKLKYELADIQVVRYENKKYLFNLLSKRAIKVIISSKDDLANIIYANYKEVNTNYNYNVYEIVIDKLLNNENLFILIHKLLNLKISRPKECRFNLHQIIKILCINFRILEGMGVMDNSDKDIIKRANIAGYYLRQDYKSKSAQDKLQGISYRLLNALKTNNANSFMDTVLNCYLYVQKTVPSIMLDVLKDENALKTIGYAFITGIIESKEQNKMNGGE
ncbi:MAG: type I-B CRISPR-associated protein Cas8b1/Cst1, partial [bacterium]